MSIIRNPTFLSCETNISEDLIFERQELALLKPLDKGYSNIMYVFGLAGVGKTTCIKYYLNSLNINENSFIYIDCKIYNSFSRMKTKFYNDLIELFPDVVDRVKLKNDENAVIEEALKSLPKKLYIVLDEINIPILNSKSPMKHFPLHYFLRLTDGCSNLRIIFMSNVFNFESYLHPEVTSMYGPTDKIVFKSYDVPEIFNILKKRAELSLFSGTYTDEDLLWMAKFIRNDFDSNIRDGILLLKTAASNTPEGTKITKEIIEKSLKKILFDKLKQDIDSFPVPARGFLKAICQLSKLENKFELTANSMIKFYQEKFTDIPLGTKKMTNKSLYYYIDMFEKSRLLFAEGKNRRTEAKYQLALDAMARDKIISEEF